MQKKNSKRSRPARQIQLSKAENIQTSVLNLTMYRINDPFPPTVRRKLRYADLHNDLQTGTAGIFGTQAVYRLNSLFDPYFTGSGHQPYGFDQIAALYNRYRVDRVSFKITFTNPSLGANINCACSIAPDTTSYLSARDPSVPREWPNAMNAVLSYEGSRTATIQGSIDLHTLCGVPKVKYLSDDRYQGTAATDPSQIAYINIALSGVNGTAANFASTFVELEYEAVFFERITVAAS